MEANRTRPLRDRPDLEAVLRTGLDLIEPVVPALRHQLVGTAAACLQGVGLPVGDVDLLLARREDVDAVAEALAGLECVVAPRWIEPSQPYFACYDLDGVGFSFSTVEQPCDDCGWECRGPGPWRHHVAVDVGGHRVDCVRLELRLVTEFLRGRPDRYRPVLAHLGEHGADLRLLRRSMAVCGVPEEFVERSRGLRAHDGP